MKAANVGAVVDLGRGSDSGVCGAGFFPGVDSDSILFSHRSFQKPMAMSPGILVFLKDPNPWKEWKWKLPVDRLESVPLLWGLV